MTDEKENMIKMYINKQAFLKKSFDCCNFKLKYDYNDENNLKRIDSLLCQKDMKHRTIEQKEITKPFVEYYLEILSDFNNQQFFDLMSMIYIKTNILKDKNRTIEDCSSRISIDSDNQFVFSINSPNQNINTDYLYAAYIHELMHFPQLIRNNHSEYYEFAEVISIYFEYLMYKKIDPENGLKTFMNNRLALLYNNSLDLKEDIFYSINCNYLELPREYYSLSIAETLSYFDGNEYVLNLIDMSKSNKKEINDFIFKVIFDKSSCKEEASKLKIDTSNYSKLLKLL